MSDVLPDIPTVLDKLAALGSPEQIALHLADREVQAFPQNPFQCAIAVHVQAETGQQCGVTTDYVQHVDDWFSNRGKHNLPGVLVDFIDRFDEGDWPELIDPRHDGRLRASLAEEEKALATLREAARLSSPVTCDCGFCP